MKIPEPRRLSSGKWTIQIMVDRRRISQTFDTKEDAQYWASGMKTKLIDDENSPKKITVKKAFENYIAARSNVLSPSTLRSYKNIQENYFADLMSKKAASITKADVQMEINLLAETKSKKTIKNAVSLLLSVLSDYTEINEKKLAYPAKEAKEHAYLEAADIAKLLDVCRGDKIEAPILLALLLGLRRSEICALDWADIDFEKKTIRISKALVPNEKNEYVLKKTTKTEKSTRVLEMPDYLIARLRAIRATGTEKEGRVTTLNPNDIYNRFKVLCDRHGIPFVGIHGLRHTNASIMLSIGITTKLAMARGGWSNENTLQNVYQHLFSDDKLLADKKINDYFAALAPET